METSCLVSNKVGWVIGMKRNDGIGGKSNHQCKSLSWSAIVLGSGVCFTRCDRGKDRWQAIGLGMCSAVQIFEKLQLFWTSMHIYIYTCIEVHLYIACIFRASGVRCVGTERRLRHGLRENSIRCRQRQTPFGSHGHGELTSIRPPATTLGRFSVEGMF